MPFEIKLPSTQDALESMPESASSTRGSHQLMAASACDRNFALRYIARLRIVHEPPYRLIGTLVHTCLAHHYASMMESPPGWYKPGQVDAWLESQGNGQPDAVRTAKEVFLYYKNQTAGDSWSPLFVEHEFSASIGELDPDGPWPELNDERVSCGTDLVVMANGLTWIVDHKCSSGGWNKERLDRWQDDGEYKMSFQAMMNLHILRKRLPEMGYDAPRGFIIQRVKRKPPFDFDRNVIQIPTLAYADAPRSARYLLKREMDIRQMVKDGIKPPPNFSHCWHRYGKCDYWNVCSADSDTRKNMVLNTDFARPS